MIAEGTERIEIDGARAAELYRRAINEGGLVGPMTKIGDVLENGMDGAEKDLGRAAEAYSRAISEENDTGAMFRGGEGLDVDIRRDLDLLAQAADGTDFEARMLSELQGHEQRLALRYCLVFCK